MSALGIDGALARLALAKEHHRGDAKADHERQRRCEGGKEERAVAADEFLARIPAAGWARSDRFVLQMPSQVDGERAGAFVAAGAILLERLEHDPIEVAPHGGDQSWRFRGSESGDDGLFTNGQLAQARRRLGGISFADGSPQRIDAGPKQLLAVERRPSGEQLVEQHAERIDVAASIDVHGAHARLFRTHVGGRAEKQLGVSEDGLVREPQIRRGLGDAEVDHLRHRHTVVLADENVRGLEVAVDDAFLVRMLDRVTDLDEKLQPFRGGEVVSITKLGDADAFHQFHHEVRPAGIRRAGVENLGDVRMLHHRQRLTFGLEPRDDRPRVHAELDDLERDAALHRLLLLREIHDTAAAFAEFLDE